MEDDKKTVLLQIRNTSDKSGLEIESRIKEAVESKGYLVVTNPKIANIMIQANILQVGRSTLESLFEALSAGIGNTVLDAEVEVVNFTMTTDLQISKKAEGEYVSESSEASLKQGTSGYKKSSWKKYQTRIMSVAKKTNLKFKEAEPKLTEGLVKSISGLL